MGFIGLYWVFYLGLTLPSFTDYSFVTVVLTNCCHHWAALSAMDSWGSVSFQDDAV